MAGTTAGFRPIAVIQTKTALITELRSLYARGWGLAIIYASTNYAAAFAC
jgi:hypothetical protein